MSIRTAAYYTEYHGYRSNQMFNIHHEANVTGNLDRWVALRDFLAAKGIDLKTHDMHKNFKDVDVWLFTDPGRGAFEFMLRNFMLPPHRRILMLVEPPLINSRGWRYLALYSWLFKVILTWSPALVVRGGKYMPWHYPIAFDPIKDAQYRANPKKNLCMVLHSNKTSHRSGELYSLRRRIVEYFDRRGDGLLDLYGYGWNDASRPDPFFTPLYRGTAGDKRETYSQYFFVFCIDNSQVPGYITYDPFIAMASGTVPIYLPMPDAHQYIPADTFVNFNDFKDDLNELVRRLQEIVKNGEYEGYRERGLAYLNSEQFRPFTIGQFCEDVYRAIQKAAI